MIRRFSIIGGGSAYAPGLVAALIHHRADLFLEEVRLYDIDVARLKVVSTLCARMAEAAGAPFTVTPVDDLAEAVAGADAILNSARPGGFRSRLVDETLPLEFGVPGQETVGPGGFFFALRSVPEALQLASTIERHAPEAVLLNYTNPTNIVTQALNEQSDVRVLGLCDQSDEDLGALAQALHHPTSPIRFRCVGLNHATWYTDISFGDEPFVSIPPGLEPPPHAFDEEHRIRFELAAEMADSEPGRWPNSYLPYYQWPARFVAHSRQHGTRTAAILAKIDSYFEHFAEEANKREPTLRHHRGTAGFGDMAAEVLRALSAKEPREIVLNVPNEGMMSEFDEDTVVEAKVRLCATGIERLGAPPLPAQSRSLLQRLQAYQRKTARAACGADESATIDALATNPLIDDSDLARQMIRTGRERYEAARREVT